MASCGETGDVWAGNPSSPPLRNVEGPGAGRTGEASRERERHRLRRIIEGEIVPRLLLVHAAGPAEDEGRRAGEDDVEELARLAVQHDAEMALAFVEALMGEGVGPDAARLGLLAPAVRRLGEQWEDDDCTFAQVSLGLSRLQQVLWRLGAGEPAPIPRRVGGGPVLVAPIPDDQHSFGALLVADFLIRDGWDVRLELAPTESVLVRAVEANRIRFVTLSVSNDFQLARARALVARLRDVRRASEIEVVVGGPAIEHGSPDGGIGADRVVGDPREVLEILRSKAGNAGSSTR